MYYNKEIINSYKNSYINFYMNNKLVAIITGSSRGIGRHIAQRLAKNGYNIVLAAKSIASSDLLPGNIYSVKDELEKINPNIKVLAIPTDIRQDEDLTNLVNNTYEEFKKIDILINNASALHWIPTSKTSTKKYDLIQSVNTRGSFLLSRNVLQIMEKQNFGKIIMHSPPINLDKIGGYTAYMISKYGMTMAALGIAQEYKNKGITANTIWPATMIESFATKNYGLGNEKLWRKPDIIVDSIEQILQEDYSFTGNMLIDEEYLRQNGVTDFTKYQCVPGFEPPKLEEVLKRTN